MQTKIQIIQSGQIEEMKQLLKVFEDVFEMEAFPMPEDAYLQKLLEKDSFFAVAAKSNGQIIGGLTVYLLDQYYAPKRLAYIYDLAVLADYQRKGIGKQLIAFTNDYCREKGYEEVFVQAEKADDYALDFYRGTHPSTALEVVHFNYKL